MTRHFGDFDPQFLDPATAAIHILPVPYDGTSTWIKGADRGPDALLDASYNLEFYDLEYESEVFQRGIYTSPALDCPPDPETLSRQVRQQSEALLSAGRFPVIIGGEHSVSIGAIQAHAHHYSDLTVLQFDAHSDLRDSYHDSRYNHACVMARARECARIVQVGIRSTDTCELRNMDKNRVFFAHDICAGQNPQWMEQALELLTRHVYITIDLDVFDPAYVPGTGTPEPGGMNWYQIINFLKLVFAHRQVTGFDIVELCPLPDNKVSDFLAAKLLYKMLTCKFND